MKIFLSWSGKRSEILASALNDWLPLVLHFVKPWMSQSEITAGDRWTQVVAQELESTNYGILCVTPENVNSAWVSFEAGALAKSLDCGKVIPLLYDLEFTELTGPLSQFQAKKVDEAGIHEIVSSINQGFPTPVDDAKVQALFSALWPSMQAKVADIPAAEVGTQRRPQQEILEDLVASVRSLDARFREVERAYEDQLVSSSRRRNIRLHPGMVEDIIFMLSDEASDAGTALLILAGFIREEFPWLYEIFIDASREIRSCDPKSAQRVLERLRRSVHLTANRPPMFEMSRSKEAVRLAMELPMILDHLLGRYASRIDDSPAEVASVDGEVLPDEQAVDVSDKRRYRARFGQ